ncbi:MAG: hypothetical protein JRJ73_16005 [Deltaproteobacteria bacterium]|nr:hypothetical protein [Deltaproteobacteria bacterium]
MNESEKRFDLFLNNVDRKNEYILLAFLASLSFILQLWFTLSGRHLLSNDDAYYYFEVAKNFPVLHQLSFDGFHLTNGVQPLYAAVLCGISWVLHGFELSDESLALTFLSVNVLFNVVAALGFFKWGRKLGSKSYGWLLFIGFSYGSFVLRHQLIGMENSLYCMMIALCAPFMLSILDDSEVFRGKKSVLVGLLVGLLFLTRVDSILFILVVGLWALVKHRYRMRKLVGELAVVGAVSFFVVLPYLAYNVVFFDHLFPISGAVKLYYSEQFATSKFGGMFTPGYLLFAAEKFIELPEELLSRFTESLLSWLLGSRYFLQIFFDSLSVVSRIAFFILPGAVLVFWMLLKWFRVPLKVWRSAFVEAVAPLRPLLPLFIFALLQMVVCTIMYPTFVRYSGVDWWFMPGHVSVVMVVSAILNGLLLADFRSEQKATWKYVALAVLIAFNSVGYIHVKTIKEKGSTSVSYQEAKYHAAKWINANLPEGAVVGSFNAGIVGFYSERPVVNLDGLINNFEYLEAMKNGEVYEYIVRNNIDYIAEYQAKSRKLPRGTFRGIPISGIVYSEKFDYPENSVYIIVKVTRPD